MEEKVIFKVPSSYGVFTGEQLGEPIRRTPVDGVVKLGIICIFMV